MRQVPGECRVHTAIREAAQPRQGATHHLLPEGLFTFGQESEELGVDGKALCCWTNWNKAVVATEGG